MENNEKILIGRKNININDLLYNLPSGYKIKVEFDASQIDENTYYKFLVTNPIVSKTSKNTIIKTQISGYNLEIIHSPRLFNFFYNQEVMIFCGKIKDNTCFFPEILKSMKSGNEIVSEYKDLPTTASHYIEKYLEKIPILIREYFRKIHLPQNIKEIQEGISMLGNIELNAVRNLLNKYKQHREPHEIFPINLPFTLTGDQQTTLQEIYADFQKDLRSVRVIHGDVGSGKTLVALIATIQIIKNGKQVVVLAPTGVLTKQLYDFFSKHIESHYHVIHVTSLTNRKKLDISHGHVFIGTHALLFNTNNFENLGLLIVDEQHRFGVAQRNLLINEKPIDVLMLTATPIPRTFSMLLGGHISLSTLKQKPNAGSTRTTLVVSDKKIDNILLKAKGIAQKNLVLWVCHTISDSEIRFEYFSKFFGKNCYLLHSKITKKEEVLKEFSEKPSGILISTTVIEVGIDIDVSFIFIENADAFGLSSLHQLRGRVARRDKDGYCILIGKNLQKLKMVRDAEDGFSITQVDYKKRGSGLLAGTLQSGFNSFKYIKKLNIKNLKFEDDSDMKFIQVESELMDPEIVKLLIDVNELAV
jgi:ATP-dependent DNA helicase RecG